VTWLRKEQQALDVEAIRAREYPWMATENITYLNAASTGPQPKRTVDTLIEWAQLRATMHTLTGEVQFGTLEKSRELCARLIGAKPAEIALATNTGYGINLAARALPLAKGDVILTPDLEFPANVYPWMAAARDRGLEYRRLPMPSGLLDEDALLAAMDDPKVRCVAVSWIGFATGYRADLARIGRACRERGIFFVVDAIQGLGPFRLDAREAHIDILACGAQKWLLSPWGSGFAYVREELIGELTPQMVGWMAPKGTDDFSKMLDYSLGWRDDARRFEDITLPYQDFAGMNASLSLLEELGHDACAKHIESLADEIVHWAQARRIDVVTPADPARRAGIVSVRPKDGGALSAKLTQAGVVHSFREGAIRFAPHIYNTANEVVSALTLIG
jgi:cysteine desulfurase / selenocysteine lyase